MFLSPKSVTSNILSNSKKISKPKLPSKVSVKESLELDLDTGYDTFLPEEKKVILNSIKKQLLINKGLDSSVLDSNKDQAYWLSLVKGAGAKSLNQMLRHLIPKYRPKLDLDVQELTNLRKKIKGWFSSAGISEKRGDPLIHDEELPRFKEVLREHMKVRNFDELRKDIIHYVREIRVGAGRKFVESMFSKKFWSTFLNKEENADMKDLWESLPCLNGKIVPKKKVSENTKFIENSSRNSEAETEGSVVNLEQREEEEVWFEDGKDDMDEAKVHESIAKFVENNLENSEEEEDFMLSAETNFTESALNTQESKQKMETEEKPEEKPEEEFTENFMCAWNERSLAEPNESDSNGFRLFRRNGQLPEVGESVQKVEWKLFNNPYNKIGLFGLFRDANKLAKQTTLKLH